MDLIGPELNKKDLKWVLRDLTFSFNGHNYTKMDLNWFLTENDLDLLKREL